MSEKDVKDASAGVLKDLKRFQLEKEEDLKRYMVRSRDRLCAGYMLTRDYLRLHTLDVTLIGQRRMSKRGERPGKKLIRSKCGNGVQECFSRTVRGAREH